MMKNKNIIILSFIAIFIILGGIFWYSQRKANNERISYPEFSEPPSKTEGLAIVPTMQDKITTDSAWVGTFQLIWNDLVNEVVKKDVIFTPQEVMVKNLNKQEFTTNMLSEAYYYKKYGFKTLDLKAEIEKAIKEKFNQESDILDLFDWSEAALDKTESRYFFYVMLYRKFEYLKEFNKLENAEFGDHSDIEYFGLNNDSNAEVRDQIEVLYYNSENDFALLINTKTKDEVIFYKSPKGNTFKEIYNNMNLEANKYEGDKIFNKIDKFKAPYLEFNELREYDELVDKPFLTADGNEAVIVKAVQTIQFYLDEKGGEIKSEAGMDTMFTSGAPIEETPRYFYVDNTFAIFLREKGKKLPYFASRIDDITKFQ